MRLPCPYCGNRDAAEFVYRGDAAPRRPDGEAGMFDYVYLRDNRAGEMRELWYHAQGCRNWIVVTRDTVTHEIHGSELARDNKR
ncbi:MAG: sarcosine oxidase subunit delta [Novosphingobium sp.]|nr:sarcosine oxidase subunit delta [Novosphingobium sp.]